MGRRRASSPTHGSSSNISSLPTPHTTWHHAPPPAPPAGEVLEDQVVVSQAAQRRNAPRNLVFPCPAVRLGSAQRARTSAQWETRAGSAPRAPPGERGAVCGAHTMIGSRLTAAHSVTPQCTAAAPRAVRRRQQRRHDTQVCGGACVLGDLNSAGRWARPLPANMHVTRAPAHTPCRHRRNRAGRQPRRQPSALWPALRQPPRLRLQL